MEAAWVALVCLAVVAASGSHKHDEHVALAPVRHLVQPRIETDFEEEELLMETDLEEEDSGGEDEAPVVQGNEIVDTIDIAFVIESVPTKPKCYTYCPFSKPVYHEIPSVFKAEDDAVLPAAVKMWAFQDAVVRSLNIVFLDETFTSKHVGLIQEIHDETSESKTGLTVVVHIEDNDPTDTMNIGSMLRQGSSLERLAKALESIYNDGIQDQECTNARMTDVRCTGQGNLPTCLTKKGDVYKYNATIRAEVANAKATKVVNFLEEKAHKRQSFSLRGLAYQTKPYRSNSMAARLTRKAAHAKAQAINRLANTAISTVNLGIQVSGVMANSAKDLYNYTTGSHSSRVEMKGFDKVEIRKELCPPQQIMTTGEDGKPKGTDTIKPCPGYDARILRADYLVQVNDHKAQDCVPKAVEMNPDDASKEETQEDEAFAYVMKRTAETAEAAEAEAQTIQQYATAVQRHGAMENGVSCKEMLKAFGKVLDADFNLPHKVGGLAKVSGSMKVLSTDVESGYKVSKTSDEGMRNKNKVALARMMLAAGFITAVVATGGVAAVVAPGIQAVNMVLTAYDAHAGGQGNWLDYKDEAEYLVRRYAGMMKHMHGETIQYRKDFVKELKGAGMKIAKQSISTRAMNGVDKYTPRFFNLHKNLQLSYTVKTKKTKENGSEIKVLKCGAPNKAMNVDENKEAKDVIEQYRQVKSQGFATRFRKTVATMSKLESWLQLNMENIQERHLEGHSTERENTNSKILQGMGKAAKVSAGLASADIGALGDVAEGLEDVAEDTVEFLDGAGDFFYDLFEHVIEDINVESGPDLAESVGEFGLDSATTNASAAMDTEAFDQYNNLLERTNDLLERTNEACTGDCERALTRMNKEVSRARNAVLQGMLKGDQRTKQTDFTLPTEMPVCDGMSRVMPSGEIVATKEVRQIRGGLVSKEMPAGNLGFFPQKGTGEKSTYTYPHNGETADYAYGGGVLTIAFQLSDLFAGSEFFKKKGLHGLDRRARGECMRRAVANALNSAADPVHDNQETTTVNDALKQGKLFSPADVSVTQWGHLRAGDRPLTFVGTITIIDDGKWKVLVQTLMTEHENTEFRTKLNKELGKIENGLQLREYKDSTTKDFLERCKKKREKGVPCNENNWRDKFIQYEDPKLLMPSLVGAEYVSCGSLGKTPNYMCPGCDNVKEGTPCHWDRQNDKAPTLNTCSKIKKSENQKSRKAKKAEKAEKWFGACLEWKPGRINTPSMVVLAQYEASGGKMTELAGKEMAREIISATWPGKTPSEVQARLTGSDARANAGNYKLKLKVDLINKKLKEQSKKLKEQSNETGDKVEVKNCKKTACEECAPTAEQGQPCSVNGVELQCTSAQCTKADMELCTNPASVNSTGNFELKHGRYGECSDVLQMEVRADLKADKAEELAGQQYEQICNDGSQTAMPNDQLRLLKAECAQYDKSQKIKRNSQKITACNSNKYCFWNIKTKKCLMSNLKRFENLHQRLRAAEIEQYRVTTRRKNPCPAFGDMDSCNAQPHCAWAGSGKTKSCKLKTDGGKM